MSDEKHATGLASNDLVGLRHTPGKWIAVKADLHGDSDDPDADRWAVCVDGPQQFFIATIENGAPGDIVDTEGINARLISAAPELYAAAKRVLFGLDARIEEARQAERAIPVFDGIADLHTAINKAEGRTEKQSN